MGAIQGKGKRRATSAEERAWWAQWPLHRFSRLLPIVSRSPESGYLRPQWTWYSVKPFSHPSWPGPLCTTKVMWLYMVIDAKSGLTLLTGPSEVRARLLFEKLYGHYTAEGLRPWRKILDEYVRFLGLPPRPTTNDVVIL